MSWRSSGVIQERCRNSTSGTSGSRSGRTSRSSSSDSSVFLKPDGYCISTPRSFPAASSGARASRKRLNSSSSGTSRSRWPVISPDAFAWKVKPGGVRSAHFAATSGAGRR